MIEVGVMALGIGMLWVVFVDFVFLEGTMMVVMGGSSGGHEDKNRTAWDKIEWGTMG